MFSKTGYTELTGYTIEQPSRPCTNRPRPANWNRFLWLSVALIAVVFAVGILVTMRASVPPSLPSFTVVSVTVTSLSSGDFRLTLAVRNPNTKADIRLDTLIAGVYYGGTVVAEAALRPMYHQVVLAERTVTARLVAAGAPLVGSGVARGVLPDMAHGGSGNVVIRFRVEATCSLAFHVDGVDTARRRRVVVRCDGVPVRLDNATAPSTSGQLVGPRRLCTVR